MNPFRKITQFLEFVQLLNKVTFVLGVYLTWDFSSKAKTEDLSHQVSRFE